MRSGARSCGPRLPRQVKTTSSIAIAFLAFTAYAAVPRSAASDYPAHGETKTAAIGAEFLVHSVPTEQNMLDADQYLVVEVGVFPKNKQDVALALINFHLRINGKDAVEADAPGIVAGTMKSWNWQGPPPQSPLPRSAPSDNSAVTGGMQLTLDQLVAGASLPEATVNKPVGGCMYFPWEGKIKKIHTLELIWEAPNSEPVTLKLR